MQEIIYINFSASLSRSRSPPPLKKHYHVKGFFMLCVDCYKTDRCIMKDYFLRKTTKNCGGQLKNTVLTLTENKTLKDYRENITRLFIRKTDQTNRQNLSMKYSNRGELCNG